MRAKKERWTEAGEEEKQGRQRGGKRGSRRKKKVRGREAVEEGVG